MAFFSLTLILLFKELKTFLSLIFHILVIASSTPYNPYFVMLIFSSFFITSILERKLSSKLLLIFYGWLILRMSCFILSNSFMIVRSICLKSKSSSWFVFPRLSGILSRSIWNVAILFMFWLKTCCLLKVSFPAKNG